MKEYRYKTIKEFERDYGANWREEVDFPHSNDADIGKPVSVKINALMNRIEREYNNDPEWLFALTLFTVDPRWITEIPQFACDIKNVYFNEEKKKVTVILRNGNEGRSVCAPEDTYDPYVGFSIAYARAVAGSSTKLREYVDKKVQRAKEKEEKKNNKN